MRSGGEAGAEHEGVATHRQWSDNRVVEPVCPTGIGGAPIDVIWAYVEPQFEVRDHGADRPHGNDHTLRVPRRPRREDTDKGAVTADARRGSRMGS